VTSNEGGEYDLHLWIVTEDVKRRMARGSSDRTRRP
jgi:hypothetical protein